jgi:1,4-alpha-glucan branching enzyme
MYAHPGKKLLFMGDEFGQRNEWDHDRMLDWHSLQISDHQGIQTLVRDLNRIYREERAMHALDCEHAGFEWIDFSNSRESVITFLRKSGAPGDEILVACNFTPVPRHGYRLGVPAGGFWREILNSDGQDYGGSGQGNLGGVEAKDEPCHGQKNSVVITLPPLAVVYLKKDSDEKA